MENLIRRGMTRQYSFYFRNWGYFYNAGFLSCEKFKVPNSNELMNTWEAFLYKYKKIVYYIIKILKKTH